MQWRKPLRLAPSWKKQLRLEDWKKPLRLEPCWSVPPAGNTTPADLGIWEQLMVCCPQNLHHTTLDILFGEKVLSFEGLYLYTDCIILCGPKATLGKPHITAPTYTKGKFKQLCIKTTSTYAANVANAHSPVKHPVMKNIPCELAHGAYQAALRTVSARSLILRCIGRPCAVRGASVLGKLRPYCAVKEPR